MHSSDWDRSRTVLNLPDKTSKFRTVILLINVRGYIESVRRFLFWDLTPCSLVDTYQTTRRHIPKYRFTALGTSNLTKFAHTHTHPHTHTHIYIHIYICVLHVKPIWPSSILLPYKTISGEQYEFWSFSLCNLLDSPITTALAQVYIHLLLHLRTGYVPKPSSYVESLSRNILFLIRN
jgi:hypothetical protein